MISVVVLQKRMDLQKDELGSPSKTCATFTLDGNEAIGVEAEGVWDITEGEDQEPTTVTVIKTEPNVSCVPVVSVLCTFRIGYIQNCLPMYHSALVKQIFYFREWILKSF